jgi:ABC-2 type transport system permease protein
MSLEDGRDGRGDGEHGAGDPPAGRPAPGDPGGVPPWVVRAWALARREVLRIVRRPTNTVLPPLVTNALYVTVFGVVLGARIGETGGVPYIQFVIPGLIGLGTIGQAFQNSSFTVFHSRWEEYVEAVVASPVGPREQVLAYLLASAVRGLAVGVAIFLLGLLFTDIPVRRPLVALGFLLLVVVLFGSLGIAAGLWADDFDQLTVFNQFLIQPLVFVGGVFYPVSDLPAVLETASLANPMVYIVSGIRFGLLGQSEVSPLTSLAVLSVASVLAVSLVLVLLDRGYGLRS